MRPNPTYVPVESIFPMKGIDSYSPTTMSNPSFCPNGLNMLFPRGIAESRLGYIQMGGTVHGNVLGLIPFENKNGTQTLVCVTDTNMYRFDTSGEVWVDISPQHLISDCEDAGDWTDTGAPPNSPSTNITIANDATDAPMGANSMKITIGADFTTGIMCFDNITSVNITGGDLVLDLYIKSSIDIAASDFSIVLSENANGAQTGTYVTVPLEAASAGVWTHMSIEVDTTGLDAVVSCGIYCDIDKGAMVLNIDHITVKHLWTSGSGTLDWVIGQDTFDKYLFITNGVDTPFQWNGTDDLFKHFDTDITGFVTCKAFAMYRDRLVVGNVTTASANKQSVAWCVPGNFTDWTATGSGIQLIPDALGEIERMLNLETRLIVYCTDTIHAFNYVGGTVLFGFERLVQNIRLVSSRAIVEVGAVHLFLSQRNIYSFNGSRLIQVEGDRISSLLWAEFSLVDRALAYAFHAITKQEVYWIIPTSATKAKLYVAKYDFTLDDGFTWGILEFNDVPKAHGFFIRDASLKWNSDSVSNRAWEDFGGAWFESTAQPGFPIPVFGSGSEVFLLDGTSLLDDGVDISVKWESFDFVVPQIYRSLYARWIELEFELKGEDALLELSFDQGSSWTSIETLPVDNDWTKIKSFIDYHADTFRLRLTGRRLSCRWVRAWFSPTSSR